ncbi:MAG: glycosyltransferase family 39 protein [Thermoanaerobaculales bacterium]|jgi:4-amino-4-deoxy-L-arabinose transferase-like glycosyltransferase|nr:glycosyltransferase family 39 protein [Thermoanaerobaculales bacterium]
MEDDRRFFFWVLLGTTILHVTLAVWAPLSGDEVYYWDCSRHPDWSSFDQPSLVIWSMIPFRTVLGETSLAIRAPAIIASLFVALALVPLVRRLGGDLRTAGLAYLMLHGIPFVFIGSSYASTDVVMIAFYSWATVAAMAVAEGDRRGWWGFGLAIGIGFLAKFPMVLALAAIAAAVIWGEGKRHLASATPYLAAAVAFACTTPVWIWSMEHNWDNIAFQLENRHNGAARADFPMQFLAEYIGANLILLSLPFCIALVIAWRLALKRTEPVWRVAVVSAATPFVFFAVLALRSRMSPHWGAPGLVVAIALLVMVPFSRRRGLIVAGVVFGGFVVAAALGIVAAPEKVLRLHWSYSGRPNRVSTSEAAEIIGNQEIADQIAARLEPGELLASSSYTITHMMAYLSDGRFSTRLANVSWGEHGLASLYWHEPESLVGRDFLFIATDRKQWQHHPLSKIFASVHEQPRIEIRRKGQLIRSFRVLRCRDLQEPYPAFTRLQ